MPAHPGPSVIPPQTDARYNNSPLHERERGTYAQGRVGPRSHECWLKYDWIR